MTADRYGQRHLEAKVFPQMMAINGFETRGSGAAVEAEIEVVAVDELAGTSVVGETAVKVMTVDLGRRRIPVLRRPRVRTKGAESGREVIEEVFSPKQSHNSVVEQSFYHRFLSRSGLEQLGLSGYIIYI